MCSVCELDAFRPDVGQEVPPMHEIMTSVTALAEVGAETALMSRGLLLDPNGIALMRLSISATVEALGQVLVEGHMIVAKGWLALYGLEHALQLDGQTLEQARREQHG